MAKGWYGVYDTAHDTWWSIKKDDFGRDKHKFVTFPAKGITCSSHVVFLNKEGLQPSLKLLASYYRNVVNLSIVEFVSYKMNSNHTVLYQPNFLDSYPVEKLIEEHKIEVEWNV